MAFALRRRNLSCFYCGTRSDHKWSGGPQQWECVNCDAVNYLDKNGQIADPPAPPTPLPGNIIRYARATSPPPDNRASEGVFCSTCLKNQHIVKESLAAFLPSEDSPNYDELLQGYDAYRERLEQRYPQVCADCAPRVRDRLRKASYVAKTDHLRRMIDKTRSSTVSESRHKSAVGALIALVGLVWCGGAVLEAAYHLLMVFALEHDQPEILPLGESQWRWNMNSKNRLAHCWTTFTIKGQRIDWSCVAPFQQWMRAVLLLSLLTIWWNPRLQHKHVQAGGRLRGLTEYYVLQTLCLAARIAAVYGPEYWSAAVPLEAFRGLHAFASAYILITLFISSKIVTVDSRPLVNFQLTDEQLLPKISQARSDLSPALHVGMQSPEAHSPFPIERLARSTPRPAPNQPPTPPPEGEDGDPDAMDWTPSAKSSFTEFHPQSRVRQAPNLPQGPSPFHGTLPPAPLPPSHKLRNPQSHQPGTFRKATSMQQENFFAGISSAASGNRSRNHFSPDTNYESDTATEATADDDPDEDYPRLRRSTRTMRKPEMEMAQPRLFLQEDMRDTGLEDIFGEHFGLQDTPKLAKAQKAAPRGGNVAATTAKDADISTAAVDLAEIEARRTRLRLLFWSLVPPAVAAASLAVLSSARNAVEV